MLKSVVFLLLAIAVLGLAQEEGEATQTATDETVTVLDLSNKGLTSLEDYDFSKYPSLEQVDLSNNELEYINEDTFIKNTKLKSLNLSGNKKLALPKYSTLLIAEIEELDLSNCGIKKLPPNALDGLIKLKVLDLHGNPLRRKAIALISLSTLLSPEKLVLPHVDEAMITEFCNELNINIVVQTDESNETIPCDGVRDGSWVPPPQKEVDEPQNEEEESPTPAEPSEPTAAAPPADENPETTTEAAEPAETTVEPETTTATTGAAVEGETTTAASDVPDAVDGPSDPGADKPQGESDKQSTEVPQQAPPAAPMQRGVFRAPPPVANVPSQENKETQQKSEKMQENKEGSNQEDVKQGESSEASTGSNILIFLVVAVVVAGVAAFGYKYYKTQKYKATNTDEPVERELKEIVTDKRMNGPEKPAEETIEQVPLMDKRKNSIEIREVDETKEEAKREETTSNSTAVNRNASSPYVSTTTTQPPGNDNKM